MRHMLPLIWASENCMPLVLSIRRTIAIQPTYAFMECVWLAWLWHAYLCWLLTNQYTVIPFLHVRFHSWIWTWFSVLYLYIVARPRVAYIPHPHPHPLVDICVCNIHIHINWKTDQAHQFKFIKHKYLIEKKKGTFILGHTWITH